MITKVEIADNQKNHVIIEGGSKKSRHNGTFHCSAILNCRTIFMLRSMSKTSSGWQKELLKMWQINSCYCYSIRGSEKTNRRDSDEIHPALLDSSQLQNYPRAQQEAPTNVRTSPITGWPQRDFTFTTTTTTTSKRLNWRVLNFFVDRWWRMEMDWFEASI